MHPVLYLRCSIKVSYPIRNFLMILLLPHFLGPHSTPSAQHHPAHQPSTLIQQCTTLTSEQLHSSHTVIKLRIHPHSTRHKHQPTRPYPPHKPSTSQTTTQHKHTRKTASIPNKPSSVKLALKTHISYPCCSRTISKRPFLHIPSYQ